LGLQIVFIVISVPLPEWQGCLILDSLCMKLCKLGNWQPATVTLLTYVYSSSSPIYWLEEVPFVHIFDGFE